MFIKMFNCLTNKTVVVVSVSLGSVSYDSASSQTLNIKYFHSKSSMWWSKPQKALHSLKASSCVCVRPVYCVSLALPKQRCSLDWQCRWLCKSTWHFQRAWWMFVSSDCLNNMLKWWSKAMEFSLQLRSCQIACNFKSILLNYVICICNLKNIKK